MNSQNNLGSQIKRNLVAIISLIVAVATLSYTTWRNDLTEKNRNYRVASFEVLLKLGELQQLVFHRHYDNELDKGNPRAGWAKVLTIKDLAILLGPEVQHSSENLATDWGQNWSELGSNQKSADIILLAIDDTRQETITLLKSLD